jgi:hypothetical protein
MNKAMTTTKTHLRVTILLSSLYLHCLYNQADYPIQLKLRAYWFFPLSLPAAGRVPREQ